ncbi:AMP-binding protein [Pseudoclavibacter sp. CFCC 14310]|uniref:AMP-binding protein n=1 Tax=Pseudoclavibacter sp. CFCC 14310 TaxID=2615180 RepID=UPI001300FD4A|nr:AMP-binding protein [Pseudoclavibacter sp. CFCC 14310]KAB1647363.1 AMP-binding protein [Pseudoclavibacter sp. CFCC 14310]
MTTAAEINATRAWNRFYADGTPKDIDLPAGSLYDMLEGSANRFGDRVAIEFFGQELTFAELRSQVDAVAEGLRLEGVAAGTRVALIMPNCPQHVIAFYAVLRLGAIVVEHNPLYTASEHEKQFLDHEADIVIAWTKVVGALRSMSDAAVPSRVISVDITRAMPLKLRLALRLPVAKAREKRAALVGPAAETKRFEQLAKYGPIDPSYPRPTNESLAVLQYTSGTTGDPKGAKITHGNLWANARQGAAWMPRFTPGAETIYGLLPMFHAFGLLLSVIYAVHVAARATLFPTFDPALVVEASKKHPATFIPAVPPMYDRLARVARDGKLDLSGVIYAISGAMTLNDAIVERWEAVAGGRLVEGYGLTECSPVALGNPFSDERKTGTIGIPFPSTDIKVVDPNDVKREVDTGEIGELLIHGPQVFQGYWNRREETEAVLLDGGWLRTGDLVTQDADGFVTVVDRKKELIITGGFNVSPSEVEAVISKVPGVAECAVVGVRRGTSQAESVTAVIVPEYVDAGATPSPAEAPGSTGTASTDAASAAKPAALLDDSPKRFDEQAAREYAREHLVEYKVPRSYVIWDELPKSLIGKVLRKEVRERLENDRSSGQQTK